MGKKGLTEKETKLRPPPKLLWPVLCYDSIVAKTKEANEAWNCV